jgi:hypothetical protein
VPWTLTVRAGPKVRRERFDAPGPALDALEERLTEIEPVGPAKALTREYSAAQQVTGRGEVRGPSRWLPAVRAGADVRGDGSLEAWTGWIRRSPLEVEPGETPLEALRRFVGA